MSAATFPRVAVLYGGTSAEHEVACAGGVSVARALLGLGWRPVLVGQRRDGAFVMPDGEAAELVAECGGPRAIDDSLPAKGREVEFRPAPWGPGALITVAGRPEEVLAEVDVVFPVLHGPGGEDGSVQGYFEVLNVPYVGCGVLASAVSMDKILMRRAFQAEDVPSTPYVWFDEKRWRALTDPAAAVAHLGLPLFVKPANMGSSIGITRVSDLAALTPAVEEALRHDHRVLVEKGMSGRELECAVLGGLAVEASAVGEIVFGGGWYDYQAKYLGEEDPAVVPAELPPAVVERVREMAVRAFGAVDGWGLSRVDFFWDEALDQLCVNEINTMPGFTSYSMYAKAWAAAGVSYEELVQRLVELGFERHRMTRRRHAHGVG